MVLAALTIIISKTGKKTGQIVLASYFNCWLIFETSLLKIFQFRRILLSTFHGGGKGL